MRIVMQPGACKTKYSTTGASFCESCFASFLMHGAYPDRPCIVAVADDGRAEITLIMRRDGVEREIEITDENREEYAFGERQGIQ